jgi:hypothetical protein
LRYWTEGEARAYLPRLRRLLAIIQRATNLEVRARGNGHATLPSSPAPSSDATDTAGTANTADTADTAGTADTGPASAAPSGSEPPEELPPGFDAAAALNELADQGIVLRDPQRGLIDFPAQHPSGRDVLLCWQLGEDDLGWWHLPEDGFAGRQPLPLPPEL